MSSNTSVSLVNIFFVVSIQKTQSLPRGGSVFLAEDAVLEAIAKAQALCARVRIFRAFSIALSVDHLDLMTRGRDL